MERIVPIDRMMREHDTRDRWEAEYKAHCEDQGLDDRGSSPPIRTEATQRKGH